MQKDWKIVVTPDKERERLIFHLKWLASMANKQFPKNGLTDKEIELTDEIIEVLAKAPAELFTAKIEPPITGIKAVKQRLNRMEGIEG